MHTSHDQGFYEIHFTLFSAIRSKNPETRIRRGSHPYGPLIPLLSIRQTLSRTPTKQTLTRRKFCIQVPHKSGGRSLERTFFPGYAAVETSFGLLLDRLTCRNFQLPLIEPARSATFCESIAMRLARYIDRCNAVYFSLFDQNFQHWMKREAARINRIQWYTFRTKIPLSFFNYSARYVVFYFTKCIFIIQRNHVRGCAARIGTLLHLLNKIVVLYFDCSSS